MRRIKNPENGAPIQAVNYNFGTYFTDQDVFQPGTTVDVDDHMADHMLKTWGFLEEVPYVEEEKKEEPMMPEKGAKKAGKKGSKKQATDETPDVSQRTVATETAQEDTATSENMTQQEEKVSETDQGNPADESVNQDQRKEENNDTTQS